MNRNPLRLSAQVFGSKVNNARFAAAARPHDPCDYERPEPDGSGRATTDIPLDGTKPGAAQISSSGD